MRTKLTLLLVVMSIMLSACGGGTPTPTPEAAAAEKRRLDTIGVLEAAQRHYQRRLGLPEGRAARDYLIGRGLTEETIARYGLGWAGERGAPPEPLH